MEDTQSCRGSSPDPFCISFCTQKVSGDLHYLLAKKLAKKLVNTFGLFSLMNVNFVSPEVFFFNLHLLRALKLHLYKTKVQWIITKKVLKDLCCYLFFSIYQLYQQIKDMKIWQQVLAQQMKPLISPILNDFDSSEAPTFLGCLKFPVPLRIGRPQTITFAAIRVRQEG